MKTRELFVAALKNANGPVFEVQCDPYSKGCGKVTTGKKNETSM